MMRARTILLPVAGLFLVALGGVFSAHTSGIVVPLSNAGQTQIAVSTDKPVQPTATTVGTGSALSAPVTVDTTPSVAVTYPLDGTSYGTDWTGVITGSASSTAGTTITGTQVAIEDTTTKLWWDGSSFGASTQSFVAVSGTTTWMLALPADSLISGDAYAVTAQATDSVRNTATSSTVSFTYLLSTTTASPSVTVSYPLDHTSYGANWSGTVTGTAASNAGDGTSITSTEVAIEDTSTKQWWNGSSFSAFGQSFVSVSGTTTWMLGLGGNDLTSGDSYSLIAEATDSAGNIGTSSSVAFSYDITPTVSVTYPLDGAAYGTDWTGTITGTASPGAGATVASTEVAIEDTTTSIWWNGSSFSDATQNLVTVTGTSTWYLAFAPGNLTSGDSYSVVAQATDSAGNRGTSPTVAFSYSVQTSAPTVTVTYPVDGTTYGADWTGTITGTAAAGAGTTINATAVAIEDTTTGQWWNGSPFAASSQTFVPVSGTTTWMTGLSPDALTPGDTYSVTAEATDSDSNVGTSPTVTFTYTSTATAS